MWRNVYKKWVSSGHLTDPSRTMTKSGNSLEAEGTWAIFGHQPSHFLFPQIHFPPLPSLSSFCHRSWEHTCMHVHMHTYKHTCQALLFTAGGLQVRKSTNGYSWEGISMAGVDHLSNTCPSRPSTWPVFWEVAAVDTMNHNCQRLWESQDRSQLVQI